MRPRPLHVAGALIIAAWLASLGWLVRREYFGETPGAAAASSRVSPGGEFYALYLNDEQIGVGATTVDTLQDGVRISERLDIALPDAAGARRIRMTGETRLTPSLGLRSFESTVAGDAPGVTLRVRALGADTLSLALAWPGIEPETRRVVAPGALPLAAIPLRAVVEGPLESGRRIEVPLVDPLTGSVRRAHYTVGGAVAFVVPDSAEYDSAMGRWVPAHLDSLTAWSLEEVGSPLGARMWVDRRGFIVRAETPYGWTMIRTAFEIAQLNLRAGLAERRATARLSPLGRNALGNAPVQAADTARAPLIPAGDPALQALAARLAPDTLAVEARARALYDFVARSIAPVAGLAPPDALAALAARRGSAEARTLLLVALARTIGIPARVVSGARLREGAWVPAVWAQLRLDEWVEADPARRQWPADSFRYPVRLDGAGHPLEALAPAARLLTPRPTASRDTTS
ncbi:MAG TPA: transglutaminase-like domain-containing protein [Gemmatimonadales bacterium]|nr:transglutaminase-like domain-containing protein [Gemmatimonadales bacterium]